MREKRENKRRRERTTKLVGKVRGSKGGGGGERDFLGG